VKPDNKLVCHFLLAIFGMSLTGCGTIPSYEDKGGRYVEATYTHPGLWEPSGHRMALCYEYGGGLWHSTIWPDTLGIYVNDGVALFTAYAASREPDPENPKATHPRLLAVRAPDIPLDITGEIVRGWAKKTGHDLNIYGPRTIVHSEQKDDMVEFTFGISASEHATVTMDWNQIADVMREVKEKGVVKKDRVWGTSYIEKEYKPEVQK
jgi:hypothetical protein